MRRLLILSGLVSLSLVPAAATARSTSPVLYEGKTSQGLQISVIRNSDGRAVRSVTAVLKCADGATRPFVLLKTTRVNRFGDFFVHDATKRASGHFDRNRMRGRISVKGTCALALTFTATR